jgi:hypothetical protein
MVLEHKLCLCFIKVRYYLDSSEMDSAKWQDNSSILGAKCFIISARWRPHLVTQVTLGYISRCHTISLS